MVKLTYMRNKFICGSTKEEKEIPKRAGFWWDPCQYWWWTNDIGKAKRLKEYADESALKQFKAAEELVEMSHAANSDIDIPVPLGLEYLPFQKAGIHYCSGKEAALIGDDMGLGKTIQAAGLINQNEGAKNIIVICPAILKLNWKNELQKWLVRNYKISVCYGTQLKTADYFVSGEDKEVYGTITIINYDILKANIDSLLKQRYDLLIADEAHYVKTGKALRTKAVGSLARVSKAKLFLTGTPLTKYPLDLFQILRMSNHPLAASWKYYTNRYCNPVTNRWGTTFGSSHEEELQEALRSGYMIRRMKSAVLSELPAKTRQVIVLPADTVKSAVDAEKTYLKAMKDNNKRIKQENSFADAIEKMRDSKSTAMAEIVRLRKETAIAKIPVALKHIEAVLENENKVVIFAHHKEVITRVYEHFKKEAVLITGETEAGKRQEKIQSFQNNSKVKVFCATIMSCGVGVTLTAAQTAVFLELDWLPSTIEQAEDRLHRIGQEGSVLVQFLVVDGSIDARIAKSFTRKKKVIDKVTNRQGENILKKEVKSSSSMPAELIRPPLDFSVKRKSGIGGAKQK